MQFRKKPVVIEAIQWTGKNFDEVSTFANNSERIVSIREYGLTIITLEGEMIANVGDWIIKGVKGELYPCKPDIFEKTYEQI